MPFLNPLSKAVLVLFALSCWQSFANNAKPPLKVLCATTHYPPYSIYDASTYTFSGSDTVIMQALAKQFGWNMQIVNLPWSRLKATLGTQDYDCYFSLGDFPERRELVVYTEHPLHLTRFAYFHRKNSQFEENKNIGIVRGIALPELMESKWQLQNEPLVPLKNNKALVDMLLKERIDSFVTNKAAGLYEIEKSAGADKITYRAFDEFTLPVYLVFSKSFAQQEDLEQINQWLKQNTN
ncbi:substrate-binding periplasmic protein [Paraglaciecola aestuariivivens]